MGLFDVHAHLTHPKLLDRIDAVIDRARICGVTTVISNGLNPHDNLKTLELAKAYPLVRPALGFYPVDTVLREMDELGVQYPRDTEPVSVAEGVKFVRDHVNEAFAIGEIGLDGYWVPESLWERQEKVFCTLVALAIEADKPLIVHTRKRERRAFELLRELGAARVNWHCFGGKVKLAQEIAAYGHYLSIPANARRSESFTRMLEKLPRDRILLETDCPYLAPEPGTQNEPANVAGTVAYAAELWGCAVDEVKDRLSENFFRLFRAAP